MFFFKGLENSTVSPSVPGHFSVGRHFITVLMSLLVTDLFRFLYSFRLLLLGHKYIESYPFSLGFIIY